MACFEEPCCCFNSLLHLECTGAEPGADSRLRPGPRVSSLPQTAFCPAPLLRVPRRKDSRGVRDPGRVKTAVPDHRAQHPSGACSDQAASGLTWLCCFLCLRKKARGPFLHRPGLKRPSRCQMLAKQRDVKRPKRPHKGQATLRPVGYTSDQNKGQAVGPQLGAPGEGQDDRLPGSLSTCPSA